MRDKKYIIRKNEKGFTLVEVLLAVGILSFGLLAVAAMQSTALLGTGRSKAVTEATTVAMDRMERIFAIPFDTLDGPGYAANTPYHDADLTITPPALPDSVESVEWEFSVTADGAYLIVVTVKSKSMQTKIKLKNLKIKLS